MDCFRPGDESLADRAGAAIGLSQTTVYRLMNSLERMNYVVRHDDAIMRLAHVCFNWQTYEQSFHLPGGSPSFRLSQALRRAPAGMC
ncbi:MAG: helix-turn-helix domain-containing protein [Enterobacter hormaechei]